MSDGVLATCLPAAALVAVATDAAAAQQNASTTRRRIFSRRACRASVRADRIIRRLAACRRHSRPIPRAPAALHRAWRAGPGTEACLVQTSAHQEPPRAPEAAGAVVCWGH